MYCLIYFLYFISHGSWHFVECIGNSILGGYNGDPHNSTRSVCPKSGNWNTFDPWVMVQHLGFKTQNGQPNWQLIWMNYIIQFGWPFLCFKRKYFLWPSAGRTPRSDEGHVEDEYGPFFENMVDDVQSGASWWNQVWLPWNLPPLHIRIESYYMILDLFHDYIHNSRGCSFPVWLIHTKKLANQSPCHQLSDWDQQCFPSHAASKGSRRGPALCSSDSSCARRSCAYSMAACGWGNLISFVCHNFYYSQLVVWCWWFFLWNPHVYYISYILN